jgi:REP element-mobilizing transposase RayT
MPRIHFDGALFHAMSRGNGGQNIFMDDEDRQEFLRILKQTMARYPFKIYAYCLMPNHFHLLIRVGRFNLPIIMQTILTRYAMHFNIVRRRKGHLFQSRYKAIPCSDDPYLLALIRYIHLNPARAGLATGPNDWPWSGHKEYLMYTSGGLVETTFPLSMFSTIPALARTLYDTFIMEGLGSIEDNSNQIGTTAAEPCLREPVAPAPMEAERISHIENLEELGNAVADETGTELQAIRGPSQAHSLARIRRLLISKALSQGFRPSKIAIFLNRSAALIAKYSFVQKE